MRLAAFAAITLLAAGIVVAIIAALGLGFGAAGLGVLGTFAIGAVAFVSSEPQGTMRPGRI